MTIKGLRTEIPDGIEITARCVVILHTLERKPAVKFEIEDNDDQMEDLRTLMTLCVNNGYRLMKVNGKKLEEVTAEKGLGAGQWIVMDDKRFPKV
jgi:hypothetical protein